MAKYHISPVTGKPERCTATKRPCKYGADTKHYESKAAANAAAEKLNESKATGSGKLAKKQVKKPLTLSPIKLAGAASDLQGAALRMMRDNPGRTDLVSASHDVDGILNEYNARTHGKNADVIAAAELVECRDKYNSYENASPDSTKEAITDAINSALPDRFHDDLYHLRDDDGHEFKGAYKRRKTPAYEGVKTMLNNLDESYSSKFSEGDRARFADMKESITHIADVTAKGRPDDDAVLTARMLEYRNSCVNDYDDDNAYKAAVDAINSGLPDALRR